jgi:hypothetical protein
MAARASSRIKEILLKQIRKRLTYANVMSSIAVFLILGGATALAATQLAKNSVGTKQLKKNAVTKAKIKKNAVTTAKIKNDAVTGAKVKDGSLTGSDINVGTLGTVPSAAVANSLVGQTPFFVRLGFGQSQTLATNGAVSFVAECLQEGGFDIVRIIGKSSVNGAILAGEDDLEGTSPTDFLNPTTPPIESELVEENETTGKTSVGTEIDQGFVLGPEGKMLAANTEGIALGLNYGSPGCLVAGLFNAIG